MHASARWWHTQSPKQCDVSYRQRCLRSQICKVCSSIINTPLCKPYSHTVPCAITDHIVSVMQRIILLCLQQRTTITSSVYLLKQCRRTPLGLQHRNSRVRADINSGQSVRLWAWLSDCMWNLYSEFGYRYIYYYISIKFNLQRLWFNAIFAKIRRK